MTCCFSHESTGHIFLNMLTFFFMAPAVMSILGNTAFLTLYLSAVRLPRFCSAEKPS